MNFEITRPIVEETASEDTAQEPIVEEVEVAEVTLEP